MFLNQELLTRMFRPYEKNNESKAAEESSNLVELATRQNCLTRRTRNQKKLARLNASIVRQLDLVTFFQRQKMLLGTIFANLTGPQIYMTNKLGEMHDFSDLEDTNFDNQFIIKNTKPSTGHSRTTNSIIDQRFSEL